METFEDHYASMHKALLKHMPNADMTLIDKAVEYANAKHQYQKRKDGSPYIIHPLAVAVNPQHHPKALFQEDGLPGAAAAFVHVAMQWLKDHK